MIHGALLPLGLGLIGSAVLATPQEDLTDAPARPAVPRTLAREDAIASIDRALGYLIDRQKDDGSWGNNAPNPMELGFALNTFKAWRIASHGLVCMALAGSEETPERRAALDAAIDWFAKVRFPARDSDWDIDYVWTALYGFVASVELLSDPRFEGDERLLRRGREFLGVLERHQAVSGGWAYYDDPPFGVVPTWATSFCTALVLPSLAAASDVGLSVRPKTIRRAQRYLELCVMPGGAYSYDLTPVARIAGVEHINRIEGSLGRTQVGNWARRRLGDRRVTDEVLREGLDAFFREHSYLDNVRLKPIPHEGFHANAGYFYFFAHYYAALAISLLPPEEREAYQARLRPHLVKTQRGNGSSNDFLSSDYLVNASTAFLVLSLAEGLNEPDR